MCKLSRAAAIILAICFACFSAGTGFAEAEPAAASRTCQDIIEEMVVYYGSYGSEADPQTDVLLRELESLDSTAAARWTRIMDLWRSVQTELTITQNILPDGLPETDELCLVVLGFQLNQDGSMKDELIERLTVAKASAEKYPNAMIVCTGGGTAANDPTATEAGRMAEWLIDNGVAPERVIVENQSLTTAQNAIYTFDILEERYPRISQLAIISSDYHIATGTLLFGAEAILRAEDEAHETIRIAANAAWHAPSGTLSAMFQAGALIELSGDVETAFDIYYETYDIHELPALETVPGTQTSEQTHETGEPGAGTDRDDHDASEGFAYVHDPRENAEAMADILENADAVYGFSPDPQSTRLGVYAEYDWTDPEFVAKAKEDRRAYHESMESMSEILYRMREEGASTEEMARAVSEERNRLRLASHEDDPEGLALVKESNLKTYGHEEGPTPDQLFEKYGSWVTVMQKAFSTNMGMDACCGLYDEYYWLYIELGYVEE